MLYQVRIIQQMPEEDQIMEFEYETLEEALEFIKLAVSGSAGLIYYLREVE